MRRQRASKRWKRASTAALGVMVLSGLVSVSWGQTQGNPSQGQVLGIGTAGQSEGLPGVTLVWGCGEPTTPSQGALATDLQGYFDCTSWATRCGSGECWVKASFIGYADVTTTCRQLERSGGKIVMEPASEALAEVVVTASISGSTLREETAPVTVLKPYLVESANAVDLKGIVSKTPGVSILDGQVSIRGGSGYSYGVGSRVQMLLDGMPLLSGDLGEIWWSYLPMEHVQQVEVVKATASSIYGSGASNGVLHMRTVWPEAEPETKVSVFNGVYSDPDSVSWRWWDYSYSPVSNGMSISHRQRFADWDVVAGGSVLSDNTYLSVGHEQRIRGNAKFRRRFSPEWQVGGGIQAQYQQMGRFILWDDFVTSAYLPMEGTASQDRWLNWHVDAWAKYTPMGQGAHHWNARTYQTSRYGNEPNPSMTSTLTMLQYRHVRPLGEHLLAQAGGFVGLQSSFSSLYPGIELLTTNPAAFGQVEWSADGWKASAGLRWEWNLNPGFYREQSGPVARLGLNRQLGPSTNLRFSLGESLRFASIAEKYLEGTLTDGITIQGNLDLRSESGNNWELGLVHEWKGDAMSMVADVSAFLLNYDEMIEYTLQVQTDENGSIIIIDGQPQFFFQPLNLGKTRISGLETSLTGHTMVGKVPIRIVAGATYNYAGDLSNDPAQDSVGVYLSNFFDSFGEARDSLVAAGSLLKYRNKGSLKVDAEWDMGPFTAGIALNHQSFIDAVDWYFLELIDGLVNYREQFTKGAKRWDARLSYATPGGQRFSLVVNNLTNGIVSTRPGIMGAPRQVMLKFDTSF
ncbi:MAG: hypothetical protein RLZZ314_1022 [Bacteroidota bacterium]|nr:TonB-dependent receptor [Bacteroidota bacterium]